MVGDARLSALDFLLLLRRNKRAAESRRACMENEWAKDRDSIEKTARLCRLVGEIDAISRVEREVWGMLGDA